jgi:hypothetical protein
MKGFKYNLNKYVATKYNLAGKRIFITMKDKPTLHEHIVTWSTLAVAVFALVAIIFNCIQIVKSDKANKEIINRMDSATQLENRAYVILNDTGKMIDVDPVRKVINGFTACLLNTGKTPAYDVNVSYFCSNDSTGKSSIIIKSHNATLGINKIIYMFGCPIPTITSTDYWNGKEHIYFRGTVLYSDIFNHRHHAYFSIMWTPEVNNNPSAGSIWQDRETRKDD